MCFFLDPSPVRRVPIQTGIQRKLNFVSVRTIKGSSSECTCHLSAHRLSPGRPRVPSTQRGVRTANFRSPKMRPAEISAGCLPKFRQGACRNFDRVHAEISTGCMPKFRQGACRNFDRVPAEISTGCPPKFRQGACRNFDRVPAEISTGQQAQPLLP